MRTGHRWTRGMSTSFPSGGRIRATMPEEGILPSVAIHVISPSMYGGTMTRCNKRGVSCIVARTLPGETISPVFTTGVISQTLPGSIIGTVTPGVMYIPAFSRRAPKGRPIPSKNPPMSPGPTETERGSPEPIISSPIRSPCVSSYTCSVALFSSIRIISPRRCLSPTVTISRMAKSLIPDALMTGPLI